MTIIKPKWDLYLETSVISDRQKSIIYLCIWQEVLVNHNIVQFLFITFFEDIFIQAACENNFFENSFFLKLSGPIMFTCKI